MKIKTSELTGAALDWAVAKCEGWDVADDFWITDPGEAGTGQPLSDFRPSTDWAQGGPIIEREHISTEWSSLWDCWTAQDLRNAAFSFTGPTPLIAAMRSYVASKFGDEVAVPDELLS